jgi:hypothetical protein
VTTRDDLERLQRWYPPAWRERYGDELAALCEDVLAGGRPSWRFRLSLARAGLRERARHSGLVGDAASGHDRGRAGSLVVLVAWAPFVIAGSVFAKLSEHGGDAATGPARDAIVGCRMAVAAGALAAGAAIAIAAATTIRPFLRSRGSGAIPGLRAVMIVAAALSAVALAGGTAVVLWAQHLPAATRETGSGAYGLVVALWAATLALALFAWTGAAVVAASRLELSRRQLRACAALAHVVGVAMVVVTIAVVGWWATVGSSIPWSLHGATRDHLHASAFDLRLLAVCIVMAASDTAALAGLWRVRTGRAARPTQ